MSAQSQAEGAYRWQPRGEVGGYAGDTALLRGEAGLFFPIYQSSDSLAFIDLRGRFFNEGASEGNLAFGYRKQMGGDRVLGAWVGYDARNSSLGNYFDQLSGGIEVLHPDWEFRLNGYLPLTKSKNISSTTTTTGGGGPPSLGFVGSQLFLTSGANTTTTSRNELALYGVDVEFGVRVPLGDGSGVVSRGTGRRQPKTDLRLFGGAYYFDHQDFAGEIAGVRARAEFRVNDVIASLPGSFAAFDIGYQYDDVRDGQFQAGLRLNIPLGKKRDTGSRNRTDALMTGFVQRDPNIVTRTATATSSVGAVVTEAINDAETGTFLNRTLFVNSGDDLQIEIASAGQNTHMVVNDGTYEGAFVLPDSFTLQGAGTDLQVVGRTTGTMATFTAAGMTPTLQSPAGPAAFTVASTAVVAAAPFGDPTLRVGSGNHVLGFNILGSGAASLRAGNDGIASNGVTTNTLIEQSTVQDTGGDGVDFRFGGNNLRLRDLRIQRTGGAGAGFESALANVELSDVAITDATGSAIEMFGDSSNITLTNVLITDPVGRGIDIAGTNSGVFTFANVDITGAGNEAVQVSGGSAAMTFDAASSITHNSDPGAVKILGGNTGTFTFAGVIATTGGIGLQFDNADGTYDFTGAVALNGGDAGIDILGGSAGTFTFTDTTITNPTGVGIDIQNSTTSLNFGGTSALTQANDSAAVNVVNHRGGTVNVMGTIGATNGTGLQFANADGTYDFSGSNSLNGGDAGIDILGGSAGTFTFSDTAITNPSGTGINVEDSTASLNFGGTSVLTQANNAVTLNVANHSGGTVNVMANVTATNGTGLQFSNADGTYDFSGTTTLNGGDAGIDIIGNSAGTFTFGDATTITNPTGVGLNIANLDAGGVVDYNGSITNNNAVIYAIDTTAAGAEVNFNTNGSNALLSTDNPNGAVFIFDADGNITQTTAMTVVRPQFSSLFATSGAGIWTFNDLTITDQMGLNGGVDVFGQTGTVNFDNLNITTDSAGTGDATTGFLAGGNNIMNVTGNSNINADGGAAIVLVNINQIDMTFGNVTSTNNLNTQLGFSGDDGIDLLNVDAGTLNVTGTTTVTNADGVGISAEGMGADLNFANVVIDTIGREGVIAGVASTNTGTLTIEGGTISNTGTHGLRFGSTILGGQSAVADINDVTFSGIGGFTVRTTNSTLSGGGNTDGAFSCNDGGGNTGSILFNGGADSCP